MPAITASTRASSTGKSQRASTVTITPRATVPAKTRREPLENTAAATSKIAKPHSTRVNVQKVTRPTSSATGKDRDTAWNFTGVARKDTPASMPAQNVARKAVAAIRPVRAESVMLALQLLAVPSGKTLQA
jgi:hypothetical protein